MGRLLVVGSTGLLGSEFVRQQQLLKTVFPTILFSSRGGVPSMNQRVFIPLNLLDIARLREILDGLDPTTIINCAAMTSVEACESHPPLAQHLNTTVPSLLASWTMSHHAKLVHYSTAAVFDGENSGYRESDHPRPLNTYARTKYHGDQAVKKHNARALILRIELTGFRGKPPYPLAEKIVRNIAAGKPFDGFTDTKFAPLTPRYVVELTMKALQKNLVGLYHVNAKECISKYNFAVKLTRAFGYSPDLIRKRRFSLSALAMRPLSTCLIADRFFRAVEYPQPTIDEIILSLTHDGQNIFV